MDEYAKFDPAPRPPLSPLPAGSCDSQVHIFGDPKRFPIVPTAAYTAFDATVEAMLAMHKAVGIDRGVIVQSTAYGTDHSALIEALSIAGSKYRGCARIDDSVSDDDLARMNEAGVCGARFNFHPKLGASRLSLDEIQRTIDRVAPLGWYFQLQMVGLDPREVTRLFDEVEANIIIDHMGPIQYDQGLSDPYFQHMLSLLERGNWWVMLSNGHKRATAAGYTWDAAMAFAQEYISSAPERMLWASDWPHPLHLEPMPNDGELLDLFSRYAPDEQTRRQILVTNPERIFSFKEQLHLSALGSRS